MNLSEIPKNSDRSRRRVGRGTGSGHGKTSGRGHNGQNSRSGGGTRPGFEGGQMPLVQRLPKQRGFKSRTKKETVNIKSLPSVFKEGAEITKETLFEKGLIKSKKNFVKIVGKPEGKKYKISLPVSASLRDMSEKVSIEKTLRQAQGKELNKTSKKEG